jgi:tRNA-dihydrouridine synthase B
MTATLQKSALLPARLQPELSLTALAPMQDITDLLFMQVISGYGSPDYFFTEYFRVYDHSSLDPHILRSITENATGRPVFAQLIGENISDLIRSAQALSRYPIAGIDLNMGCPAPRIYRKNVGGGLLRNPEKISQILGALRQSIDGLFTVKMRIGFEDAANFERILDLINLHNVDLLSLHGRTVKESYHGTIHYDLISQAVKQLNCPVLANGNVSSAVSAAATLEKTGAAGVTISRAAIRNPWIFKQVREHMSGRSISVVTLAEVRHYIDQLNNTVAVSNIPEQSRVNYLKKYLNFVGQGVDTEGKFLFEMRRARTEVELFGVCDRYLLSRPDQSFAVEPYPGLIARPSCETEQEL